jgi:hypothetical protein
MPSRSLLINNIMARKKRSVAQFADDQKWKLLLPFKVAMVAALKAKKKNVKITTPIKDVAIMFSETFVKKNYEENYEDSFENEYDYNEGNEYDYNEGNDNYGYHYERDNFVLSAAAISAIVVGIVSWFKDRKKAKEDGEQLSDAEQKAVLIGEKIESDVDEIKADETTSAIGEGVQKFLPLIILGVGAFLLFRKK